MDIKEILDLLTWHNSKGYAIDVKGERLANSTSSSSSYTNESLNFKSTHTLLQGGIHMAQGQSHSKEMGQVGKAKAGMTKAPKQHAEAAQTTVTEHGEKQFGNNQPKEGARQLGSTFGGSGTTLGARHERNVERITSPVYEMIRGAGLARRQEDSILVNIQAMVQQLEAYFLGDETQQIWPQEAVVPSAHA